MKYLFYAMLVVCQFGASVLYWLTPCESNLVVLLYMSCVLCGTLLVQSHLTYLKKVKEYNTLCNTDCKYHEDKYDKLSNL